MLFNSFEFAVFLPIVFCLYWVLNSSSLKIQNGFILLASYVFYGWWDWRFLSLIIISSVVDYIVGLFLYRTQDDKKRKLFLGISLVTNLCILGFFKYFGDAGISLFQPGFAIMFTFPWGAVVQRQKLAI